MSDIEDVENFQFIGKFIESAMVATKHAWQQARTENENRAHQEELWRELTSLTASALSALEKAVKMARKGFEELVLNLEKQAAKDDDIISE